MFSEVIQETGSALAIAFKPESREALETRLFQQLKKDGYSKIGQSGDTLTFERGSFVTRIFLGAFYKYFKWDFRIIEESDRFVVTITQKVSGMWGGVIGVNQSKTELQRLKGVMMNWK